MGRVRGKTNDEQRRDRRDEDEESVYETKLCDGKAILGGGGFRKKRECWRNIFETGDGVRKRYTSRRTLLVAHSERGCYSRRGTEAGEGWRGSVKGKTSDMEMTVERVGEELRKTSFYNENEKKTHTQKHVTRPTGRRRCWWKATPRG